MTRELRSSLRRAAGMDATALLAATIGALCLTPGLAFVNFRDFGLQPVLLALIAFLPLIGLPGIRLPAASLVWIILAWAALAIGTAASLAPAVSARYFVFQGGTTLIGGLVFAAIVGSARQRRAFLTGYFLGATASAVIAIGQLAITSLGGPPIALANNVNFSLVAPVARGAAFTPEPSTLAALLIPALLVSWVEMKTARPELPALARSRVAFILLALGAFSTKSSSLFFLPLLLIAAEFGTRDRWLDRGRGSLKVIAFAAVTSVLFASLYGTRLENLDAQNSSDWRVAKMAAGLAIFASYPWLGAGLGSVSEEDFFEPYLTIPENLSWSTEPRKGVDSTVVRTLAETGVVGFVVTYLPVLAFIVRPRLPSAPCLRAMVVLGSGLLFSQAFLVGYRDFPVFLLPLILFAAIVVVPKAATATGQGRLSGVPPARLSANGAGWRGSR